MERHWFYSLYYFYKHAQKYIIDTTLKITFYKHFLSYFYIIDFNFFYESLSNIPHLTNMTIH